jgi:hypothetical protein
LLSAIGANPIGAIKSLLLPKYIALCSIGMTDKRAQGRGRLTAGTAGAHRQELVVAKLQAVAGSKRRIRAMVSLMTSRTASASIDQHFDINL